MVAAFGLLTLPDFVSGAQSPSHTTLRREEYHPRAERARSGPVDPIAPNGLESTPLDRFRAMSPAERKAAIAALPPRKRIQVEAAIKRLQGLPPAERKQLLARYEKFERLDARRQAEVRTGIRQLRALPEARRMAVKQEWDVLKKMPREQREAYIVSRDFKHKLNPAERNIIRREALVLPD